MPILVPSSSSSRSVVRFISIASYEVYIKLIYTTEKANIVSYYNGRAVWCLVLRC